MDDLAWRPVTEADAPALAALLAAAEAVDDTGTEYSTEDVAEELRTSFLDLPTMTTAGFHDGELVAYGALYSSSGVPAPRVVHLDGTVHPAHRGRGLGRRLVDWTVTAARGCWSGPVTLQIDIGEGNTGKARLFERSGFTEVRRVHRMECALPHPNPVVVPEGLRLAPYEPRFDEPLRLARNTAFAEHWGSVPRERGPWREMYTGTRLFRPELTFLLLDAEDRIAAYLISHRHGDVDTLWVLNVGTRPEHRKRGCAAALLAHTLNEAPAHGYRAAGLGVDTGNATGAVGLYERAGFAVRRRTRLLDLPLP